MNDPDWLQKYKDENPSGGQRGWLPGQSGNPAGRPKGAKNKKTALVEAFENEGSAIARKVIEAALAGDMQAANICLSRLSPPLRARAEKVQFELTPDAPLTTQAQQILTAVAAGDVDPETGQLLINCIASFAGLKATDELEARLAALEGGRA
ncbi:MAG: DUF5681 domain-containing protein [Thiobacillus sp.]